MLQTSFIDELLKIGATALDSDPRSPDFPAFIERNKALQAAARKREMVQKKNPKKRGDYGVDTPTH